MEKKQLRKTEISFERTSSLGTVKMRGTRNFLFTTLSLSLILDHRAGQPQTSCQWEIKRKSDSSIAATRWLVIPWWASTCTCLASESPPPARLQPPRPPPSPSRRQQCRLNRGKRSFRANGREREGEREREGRAQCTHGGLLPTPPERFMAL